MNPPRPRICLLLAGAVLCGGILFKVKFTSPRRIVPSPDQLQIATATLAVVPAEIANDEEANRAELRALFPTPRPVRTLPELSVLFAFADREHEQELSDLLGILSDYQCLQLLEQLRTQPASDGRDVVMRAILASFADHERHVPLTRLMAMSDPDLVRKFWEGSLHYDSSDPWVRRKPEETARWLVEQGAPFLSSKDRTGSIATSIVDWSNNDLRAAAEFAYGLPLALSANSSINGVLTDLARRLSKANFSDMLAWAEAMPITDSRRTTTLLGVLYTMTDLDPARARSYVEQQIGVDKDAGRMVNSVAYSLAFTAADKEEVARWGFSLPDADARRSALRGIALAWMASYDWGFADETAPAVSWAGSLPASDSRGAVWSEVAAYWFSVELEKAKSWVSNLPDGNDRSEAIAAYDRAVIDSAKYRVIYGDANEAVDSVWSHCFNQQFAAEQSLGLLATWADHDAPAANRWAAQHGILNSATGTRGR